MRHAVVATGRFVSQRSCQTIVNVTLSLITIVNVALSLIVDSILADFSMSPWLKEIDVQASQHCMKGTFQITTWTDLTLLTDSS